MEIGKLGFMGHFTAIPGVILSEAAFGGEVEESASPHPKQRKRTDPSVRFACSG